MNPMEPQRGNDSGPGGPGGQGDRPGDTSWPRWAVWLVASVVIALLAFSFMTRSETSASLDWSQVQTQLQAQNVATITIDNSTGAATGEFKEAPEGLDKEFASNAGAPDSELRSILDESGAEVTYTTPASNAFLNVLLLFAPFLLLIALLVWLNRRAQGQMGSIMQIGRSRAKVYTTEKPKTTFEDVAGHDGPKQEIKEVVSFLKEGKKFKELGAKVPRGVLLVGPPGTGKTLLARAVAGEADVPFIAVTGSDFMEMFVGIGASRVRDLFQTARKQAPAVIFIDEIDSIGRKRGAGLGGGHDEREQTLNQLLAEMDGFEGAEGIVMMAATNRPDILDPALLRPGRFDRQIVVPLPTQKERSEILVVHTADKKLGDDVDLEIMARGTPGFSGADLANLTNEAALHAVRAGHTRIEAADFDSARDRILMGIQRDSLVMSEHEKRITAYHEAGHALCGALTEGADDIHKVTILPVGMALGVTHFLPDERNMHSKEHIEARLVVALGGRVSEKIVFDILDTGAQNDLQQATKLARKMVKEWGMSEKLGPVSYGGESELVFLGDEIGRGHEYSEQTARLIDEEVARIVTEAEVRATQVLTENRAALDLVAQALMEREQIDGAEVHRLVRVARGEEPAEVPAPAVVEEEADATPAAAKEAPKDEPVRRPTEGFGFPPPMPGVAPT
jgi:cell division protease FtsH